MADDSISDVEVYEIVMESFFRKLGAHELLSIIANVAAANEERVRQKFPAMHDSIACWHMIATEVHKIVMSIETLAYMDTPAKEEL